MQGEPPGSCRRLFIFEMMRMSDSGHAGPVADLPAAAPAAAASTAGGASAARAAREAAAAGRAPG